ncbi:MAG: hypothetical protein ACK5PB_18315 [Pirellula sp.]
MLTSQNNSRTATATTSPEILGEVRWYEPSTERSGEIAIHSSQCTIGSNPACTLCLTANGVADVHVSLVFGKRFILLKAPYLTLISGRQIRELLIDKSTVLTIGSVNIEIVPRHELGKKTNRPRVIRSQDLVEHANLLSQKDVRFELGPNSPIATNPAMAIPNRGDEPSLTAIAKDGMLGRSDLVEDRFVAIEATLGKLQSAVETIQSQTVDAGTQAPIDLTEQLAAMGRSVADELEQRLATRLDSQSASQVSLVNQIRDEALRPLESTLEGLLVRLDTLSSQQIQTSDRLEALAASTDVQLAEWNQWRDQLVQSIEQAPSTYDRNPSTHDSVEGIYADDNSRTFQPLDEQGEYPYNLETPRDSQDNQGLDSNNQEAYPGFTMPDYSEAQFHVPHGLEPSESGLQTDFDRYASLDTAYDNTQSQTAELPSNELSSSWGQHDSHVPAAWEERPEINPFRLPENAQMPRLSEPAYEEQVFCNHDTTEGNGTYSTDYGSDYQTPILSTIENQSPARDKYSDIQPDDVPADFPRESARPSNSNRTEVPRSEEEVLDYQPNSPLAAYLRSPLTDIPGLSDNSVLANGYSQQSSGNNNASDAIADSGYFQPSFNNSPYAGPAPLNSSDDVRENDVLPEPTNELSLRLRQMLAELKAEGSQSNVVEEPDSLQHQEIVSETQESVEVDRNTSSSWLRDTPSYYLDETDDQVTKSPNNHVEAEDDAAGYYDRNPSHLNALGAQTLGAIESSDGIPSFDWKNGSLLYSEEDSSTPDLDTHGDEEPSQMDRADRSTSTETTSREHADERKEDRDESIEEYMQKLLQRVKQGPDGVETQIEELTVRSAPRSRREFLERASKSSEPQSDSQESSTSGEPTSRPTKRPSPRQVDMDALRELANSNARRAIERSETKRASTTILIKVAITFFAIAASALILLLNGLNVNPPFAGFVAALIVAFLWGTDCYKHFKALKSSKQSKSHESDPNTAEEIDDAIADPKSGNEAERGWRPSPI